MISCRCHLRVAVRAAAVLAVVGLAASACSNPKPSSATTASSTGPIYVAVDTALSGTLASYGRADLQGIQVGADEINAQGGLLGRKVQVVYKDDQSDPATASLAAQSLISQYHPSLLFPGTYSSDAQAAIPFATSAKVITIEPAPGFVDPSKYPYNYNIYYTPNQQAILQAVSLDKVKAHKVAIISSSDTGSVSEAAAFSKLFPKLGFDVVAQVTVDPDAVDLSTQVEKAKAAGADTILLQVPGPEFDEAATAVADLNWHNVNLMAGPTANSPQVMQGIPASVKSQFHIASSQIYARPSATALSPAVASFAAAVEKHGQITDIGIAAAEHDLFWDWATAVKRAGTTDTAAVNSQLEQFYKNPVPAGTNLTLPIPAWSSTVHDMSTANITNSYALLQPSASIQGTLLGTPYALPAYTKTQLQNFFGPGGYSTSS
jgi:branched-chain amino acid transport system substrate-binding protein